MTLPTQFVSPRYDQAFLNVHAPLFGSILSTASGDPKLWENLMLSLNKHSLLTIMMPQSMTIPPISIKMPDGEFRTVQYDKPLACGFNRTDLGISREQIADPAYMAECSAILAYMWARKILPAKQESTHLILLHTNRELLLKCLHKLHRGQSDAETVAKVVLSNTIDSLIEPLLPNLQIRLK